MLSKQTRRELEALDCGEPEDLGVVEFFPEDEEARGGYRVDRFSLTVPAFMEDYVPGRLRVGDGLCDTFAADPQGYRWLDAHPPGSGEVIPHRKPKVEDFVQQGGRGGEPGSGSSWSSSSGCTLLHPDGSRRYLGSSGAPHSGTLVAWATAIVSTFTGPLEAEIQRLRKEVER